MACVLVAPYGRHFCGAGGGKAFQLRQLNTHNPMLTGCRIILSREGWYYLFVVVFIMGGAVLREVNLLVVLAGMMIGPLLFNWRLVTLTLRRLEVRRILPRQVCAGDPVTVDLAVANHRRHLSSWAVVVEDRIMLEDSRKREDRTRVEVMVPFVAPRAEASGSYHSSLTRRGRYRFGPIRVSTRFPLGLLRGRTHVGSVETLIVCPRLGHLTRDWQRLIGGDRVGNQRSRPRYGVNEEGDFYGLRQWRPGDSQRLIHWRTSAKISMLAVRQLEQQHNPDLAIVLDLWQDDQANTPQQRAQVELAVSFAATAIVDYEKRGANRLSVAVAGSELFHCSGTTSPLFTRELLQQLAFVQAGDGQQLREAMAQTCRGARSGLRIVVISTRAETVAPWNGDEQYPGHDVSRMFWIDVSDHQHARFFEVT